MGKLINVGKAVVAGASLVALLSCGPPPERCHPSDQGMPADVDVITGAIPNDIQYPITSFRDPTYFRQGHIAVKVPERYNP